MEPQAPPKYEPVDTQPQPQLQQQPQQLLQQQPPVVFNQPAGNAYHTGYMQGAAAATTVQPVHINLDVNRFGHQQARSWSTSLCSCFEDMGSCCCVTCCGPCYLCCHISPRMGESCCAPICLSLVGQWAPLIYRAKLRAAQGIMGGVIDDCCMTMFCAPCVVCQIKREMDFVERSTGAPTFN